MGLKDLTSPVEYKQPFMWYAEYKDGTFLEEFESETKENNFKDIDKDLLVSFGLCGRNVKLSCNSNTGKFNIVDKEVEFYIKDKSNTLIKLTDIANETYTDVISFKSIYKEFSRTGVPLGDAIIDGYFFGYKHRTTVVNKGDMNFKIIYAVPMGKTMKFGLSFSPKFDLKGNVFMKINGELVDSIFIDVNKNESNEYELDFILNQDPIKPVTINDVYRNKSGNYFIIKRTAKAIDESSVVILQSIITRQLYADSLFNINKSYERVFSSHSVLSKVK